MNVVCIGSGYVGSVTAAAFAALGHSVTVIDIDSRKVELINAGKSPIFEPGQDKLIASAIKRNVLSADNRYDSVADADVVFIAVGTPSLPDGTADLAYVKAAAENIAQHLNPARYTVIVNKSTVPVGTADLVESIIEEISGLQMDTHFSVVSNPEFLREGYALEDVFFPDRIVIGANHDAARAVMRELYHNLLEQVGYEEIRSIVTSPKDGAAKAIYFETDRKSSEMIKYASNAFLSVKISYINEIARLCEALSTSVVDVAKAMGHDSRIGNKFLEVSSGWSGSCFPKDTSELLSVSQKYGNELSVVKAAVESNRRMHEYVVEKLQRRLKTLNGKRIGILGLTFKPNTDDARHTQASVIIEKLLGLGARISAHDPKGMEMFKNLNPNFAVRYCIQDEQVAKGADAVVLLTHWAQYGQLNWEQVYREMRHPYVLDTRNYLIALNLPQYGFNYEGIGI